jgi:hypothetical protein
MLELIYFTSQVSFLPEAYYMKDIAMFPLHNKISLFVVRCQFCYI